MYPILAVVGRKGGPKFKPEYEQLAFDVGVTAAEMGFSVLTGGHGGVMWHALRGAKSVPDAPPTIGILKYEDHSSANPFCDIALPTGLGIVRNIITSRSCHCMVALPGGKGTLEEMLFAIEAGRPVASFRSHNLLELGIEGAVNFSEMPALKSWMRLQRESFAMHSPKKTKTGG